MSVDDEDVERRLRAELTRRRPSDHVDTETFLARVHHRARVRRVKRGLSVGAAGVLLVAGGGAAVNAGGFLDTTHQSAADAPHVASTSTPPLATSTPVPPTSSAVTSPSAPVTPPSAPTASPGGSPRSTSHPTSAPSGQPAPVTIYPKGPIPATAVTPLSFTATGTMHQWVLASTPGADCGRAACATVLETADHGASWTDVGQLPAPPASGKDTTSTSVSQLRFTKRDDGSGTYDGWAYGGALWSTHDSGRTWSTARAPAGWVTQLEAWGGYAYAGVSSAVPGDDTAVLYRSPTTTDDWRPVDVGARLASVQALAAADGVIGLIDSAGLRPVLYVSPDGQQWQRQSACPAGSDPTSLSTAGDAAKGYSALWLTCTGVKGSVLRYTDTTALGTWHNVDAGPLGPDVMVAAEDPRTAFVAGAGVTGITRVSVSATPSPAYADQVGVPVFFGFTNPLYGYLLTSDGSILSTTTGGGSWTPYAVSDTSP